jgi:hypothetical protein
MVNKARGEVSVEVGGESFVFVANLGALAEIEDALGKTFPQVAADMQSGSVSVRVLLACADAFARAGGSRDTSKLRQSNDLAGLAGAVGACVSAAFAGQDEAGNADGAKT